MPSLLSRETCLVDVYAKPSGETIINNPRPLEKDRKNLSQVPRPAATQSCTLLEGLPTEIRVQIWSYILANNIFHIDLLPGRLGSRICSGYDTTGVPSWVDEHGILNMRKCRDVFCTSIIALLQTCRQVYTESIDLLYQTGTFDISDLGCLKYFVEGIRSESLVLIPELHVHWPTNVSATILPYAHIIFSGNWEMFWRIVFAEFEGLRRLTIHLTSPENHAWTDKALYLFMTRRDISGWTFWIGRDYTTHNVIRGRKGPASNIV